MSDELLDIVNEQDEVVGQKLRSEIYHKKISCFRVVNAFIRNRHGQLWIPRRTKSKRLFPSCLDASMGGHVAAGESYQEAFTRELMEELRIDVHHISYEEIGTLTPHQHTVSAFMKVYLLQCDEVPDYNRDDFVEYFWLTPQELLSCIENGDTCKDDVLKIIRYLFVS